MFARGDLPDKMHAALIERTLGGGIVGVIARDATEIEAREKPTEKEANDKNDNPPPPDSAAPPRKRGRPRKHEDRPKPEPKRLERQTTQNLDQMLAELPTACDVGCKKNSNADSDEAGHALRKEAGHRFRSEAGRDSDLMPATQRSLPRIGAMMLRRDGSVKRAPILGLRRPRRMVGSPDWVAVGNGGRSAPSTAP